MRARSCTAAAIALAAGLLLQGCADNRLKLEITPEVEIVPPTIRGIALDPSGRLDTRDRGHMVQVRLIGDPNLEARIDINVGIERPSRAPGGAAEPAMEAPGSAPASPEIPAGALPPEAATGEESATPPVEAERIEKGPAEPGAEAFVRSLRLQETEPGVYVGSFEVVPGEVGSLSLVGHLAHPPTGAAARMPVVPALQLFVSRPMQMECAGVDPDEYERQLAGLMLHFEFDRYELQPASKLALIRSRDFLLQHPDCRLVLHGHADEVGSPEYNLLLSQKRALEVAGFLEGLGVLPDRIVVQYHGESQPLDPSDTPEARARNRRVEFRTR